MVEDDGKSLFDFLPNRPTPSPVVDDPFETAAGGEDPALQEAVLEALRVVHDPEIPVNIVDLGLIYSVTAGTDGSVLAEMTLTSPSCPVAGALPGEVEQVMRGVPGVTRARVSLVWTPPWHPGLMSEEAKLELGML